MDGIRELYQELIIDHGRHPRNFGELCTATHHAQGYNPLCGDQLYLDLELKDGVIINAGFRGEGCAISMASASLMTETLKGKTVEQAESLFSLFHRVVTEGDTHTAHPELGKLAVLTGVSEFPARVKCATLAWHTLHNALSTPGKIATTDDESA